MKVILTKMTEPNLKNRPSVFIKCLVISVTYKVYLASLHQVFIKAHIQVLCIEGRGEGSGTQVSSMIFWHAVRETCPWFCFASRQSMEYSFGRVSLCSPAFQQINVNISVLGESRQKK